MPFEIDPVFMTPELHMLGTPMCKNVWTDKYRYQEDETWNGMAKRVAEGVHAKELVGSTLTPQCVEATRAIELGLWMPAGRILAGAGTTKRVTMLNCFVNEDMEDDMASIAAGLGNIMLTMQQGGGIGTDFSPLRPPGAILRRTGSIASGPGPFIDTWDSACSTIRSAGDRRGAMMGTLICTHPFLPEFIVAKQQKGRWTNFNVSVLVTDAFMGAVQEDEDWWLHHPVPPAFERPGYLSGKDFNDDEGVYQYVYSVHKARTLWDQIIGSTYATAEPGVIFIDRVNDLNNLQPWETINCTNPCGEQPLPKHGCCDLGANNLSRMVRSPFTDRAGFDWDTLKAITRVGVRFLDNVIDTTNYPLPQQREEEFLKRRIGIGQSGLCDAMHMLGMRYGSPASCDFAESVSREIAVAAYETSIDLAKEKGCAPIFQSKEARQRLLDRPFIQKLPVHIQRGIARYGLRNGVLLTIAPVGTTSIAYGNISSGLEPVFAHSLHRRVRQSGDGWDEYDEVAFGARTWLHVNPGKSLDDLPAHMNVCADVRIHEHIRIQEVCQKWVDASISKTINVPEQIAYEDFKDVYHLAYDSGCKGCTTYRPSDLRGSILSTSSGVQADDGSGDVLQAPGLAAPSEVVRPDIIDARTIKIRWPNLQSSLYLTVGYADNKPYEVFINSKDQKALEWTMALTILMSLSLRRGTSMRTIADEFQQVHALEGGWAPDGTGKQRYWPSLIAYLGHKMLALEADPDSNLDSAPVIATPGDMFLLGGVPGSAKASAKPSTEATDSQTETETKAPTLRLAQCPKCNQYAVTSLSGCLTCTECGWSKCQ